MCQILGESISKSMELSGKQQRELNEIFNKHIPECDTRPYSVMKEKNHSVRVCDPHPSPVRAQQD